MVGMNSFSTNRYFSEKRTSKYSELGDIEPPKMVETIKKMTHLVFSSKSPFWCFKKIKFCECKDRLLKNFIS